MLPKLFVADNLFGDPQKRLLEVIVALRRDIEVLQVLFTVKCDLLSFHLAVLNLNFISREDDRNIFTDSGKVAEPVWDVFVPENAKSAFMVLCLVSRVHHGVW